MILHVTQVVAIDTTMLPETVYFVHISDTHIGPSPAYARSGHVSLPSAQRLIRLINELPVTPDFVIHTGDVVTEPHPDSYALAAETFAQLKVPIYYVTGNHDTARDIHRYLSMGPKLDMTADPDVLSYTFEIKGYRFLVLDGRGPDEIDPHGILSSTQLEVVQREVEAERDPLTIFIHFPVLPMDAIWMDANALLLNGEAFHQSLLPARERLRGVFYGHVHQPTQTMRDGILYVAGASAFSQFVAWPQDLEVKLDSDQPPAYSFVHLMPEQTIIHQRTFPRP